VAYAPTAAANVGPAVFKAGGDQMMIEPAWKIARLLSN
jgi:hypothetical protein